MTSRRTHCDAFVMFQSARTECTASTCDTRSATGFSDPSPTANSARPYLAPGPARCRGDGGAGDEYALPVGEPHRCPARDRVKSRVPAHECGRAGGTLASRREEPGRLSTDSQRPLHAGHTPCCAHSIQAPACRLPGRMGEPTAEWSALIRPPMSEPCQEPPWRRP